MAAEAILNKSILCPSCKTQNSKYTCPRCSFPYCSLACYKTHSVQCTESFYKDNVIQHLHATQASSQDKVKMAAVLKRFHEQEDPMDESDEEDELLEQRLAAMDLDDPMAINSLPPRELEKFRMLVETGQIGSMLILWTPWWSATMKRANIEVIGAPDEEIESTSPPPACLNPIPPLSSLLKTNPSPLIAFNLIDMLYAYAYSKCFHNGDWTDDPLDAQRTVLEISDVLQKNAVHQNVFMALQACLHNSLKPSVKNSKQFSVGCIESVKDLLVSREYVLAALSDLHRLFDPETATRQKSDHPSPHVRAAALTANFRKIFFMISWANEQPDLIFEGLRTEVSAELQRNLELLEPPKPITFEQEVPLIAIRSTTAPKLVELS